MYVRRVLNLFVVLLFAFLSAGCNSIPKQAIDEYAGAFQQAKAAGDALLDKVSPIIAATEQSSGTQTATTDCVKDKLGMPTCFNLSAVRASGQPTDPPSVLVRRVALNLIANYNAILVDLANGKSSTALQTRINDMASLASGGMALLNFNPALGAALPTLAGEFGALARRLEQMRANGVAREGILAGRKPVQALLHSLANDAPLLYQIYRKQRRIDYANASIGGADKQGVVDDVGDFYDAVASYVRLLDKTSAALDVLAEAAVGEDAPTIDSLRAAIQQATEIKNEAQTFWEAIRKVRGTSAG